MHESTAISNGIRNSQASADDCGESPTLNPRTSDSYPSPSTSPTTTAHSDLSSPSSRTPSTSPLTVNSPRISLYDVSSFTPTTPLSSPASTTPMPTRLHDQPRASVIVANMCRVPACLIDSTTPSLVNPPILATSVEDRLTSAAPLPSTVTIPPSRNGLVLPMTTSGDHSPEAHSVTIVGSQISARKSTPLVSIKPRPFHQRLLQARQLHPFLFSTNTAVAGSKPVSSAMNQFCK